MSKRSVIISLLLLLASACASPIPIHTSPVEKVQNTQPVLLSPMGSTPIATATPIIVTATEHASLPIVQSSDSLSIPQVCPGAPAPHVALEQQVTVLVENFDKLKLRSTPEISPDTEKVELDKFTQLKILEGPVCVTDAEAETSYWFWKVGIPPGTDIGWVAEGDSLHYYIE